MSYPNTLDTTFLNPYPNDQRAGHAQLHRDINAVVIALQAKLGIDGSLDIGTIDYLLKSALNPGHTHSVESIGLSEVINALQLTADNNLSDLTDVSLAVETLGLTYALAGFASQAESQTGSNETKFMNPLRTAQAITALWLNIATDGEATARTIENKAVNPKQLGNFVTEFSIERPTKPIIFTKNIADATWDVIVNHSLGVLPKMIIFTMLRPSNSAVWESQWSYSASTGYNKCIALPIDSGNLIVSNASCIVISNAAATASNNAYISNKTTTDFTLHWVKTWSPTGVYTIIAHVIG